MIELSEERPIESGPGWEAFRGTEPGNYEVFVTAFKHGTPVVMLTAVSTAKANEEPPSGFPEPPVIADAEHIHLEEGFFYLFNVNVWKEGKLTDRPVYFTVSEEGAG